MNSFRIFLKSYDLYKGIIFITSVLVALVPAYFFDYLDYGLPIAIGVFINAPSDVTGSLKRKVYGILITIGLTSVICIITALFKPFFFPFLLVIAVLSICSSLLSVYGLRGSLIAFSCLVTIVLSLVFELKGLQIFSYTLLLALGGLWYLCVSLFFYWIQPKKVVDQLLADTLTQTGEFLVLRGKLLTKKSGRDKLLKGAMVLQTQISEKHELLRELLLHTRKFTGRSHYDEKRLLMLTSLIDIYELALANTLDYARIDELFQGKEEILKTFKNVNLVLGSHLKELSENIIQKTKISNKNKLLQALDKADRAIEEYLETVGLPEARHGALMLKNLYDYQQQLLYKIRSIRRVIANVKNASKISIKSQDADLFIPHQEYSFGVIKQHLTFKSPIFRHATRLTSAIIVGYLLGTLLDIKNTYWIILTLVVIMRPSYGLTKERSLDRIKGTLLGAALAFAVILLTDNIYIYFVLGAISMTLALAMLQQNYLSAAAFITINIILVFSIASPNALELIQYRVVDTIIGVVLALLANYILWPSWEFKNIDRFMVNSLQKNTDYLIAIKELYHSKEVSYRQYKMPRKEAFLAISNLNAGFQRMSQDPKSKQQDYGLVYDIVTLSNTFLSAVASLGSYIQSHKTTEASIHFDALIGNITNTLERTAANLDPTRSNNTKSHVAIKDAEEKLKSTYRELEAHRNKEIEKGIDIKEEVLLNLQEIHLLYNQLIWLKDLSNAMEKVSLAYSKAG